MTKNHPKIQILFTLLVIFPVLLFSQPANQLYKEVAMPAPTPASLGKYVDIPVSHHTGVPNISIPIESITEGPLSLTISLNYHSSGVRVDEVAGSHRQTRPAVCHGL